MSTQEDTIKQDLNKPETPANLTENVIEPSNTCDTGSIEEIGLQQPDPETQSPVEKEKSSEPEENITTKTVEETVATKTVADNQAVQEETNENDTSDKTSSTNKSRELKSILALSKEAKLDTNLPAKRKESTRKRDFAKLHSIGLSERIPSKSSQDAKPFKFPVTAEAELEEDSFSKPHGTSMDSPKPSKRARTTSRESSAGSSANEGTPKNRRICSGEIHVLKPNKDMFCWRCHKDNVNIACETCPRTYHWKCLRQTVKNDKEHWPCPECVSILKAESTHTRSEAMKGMTLEHLCSLLKYALNRMIQCQGSEPFLHPVNDEEFPDYKKYIIQPMDLTKIEKNIKNNLYGSTQAFEADAKWILHNCIIFNSYQSKLTYTAKNIVRVCKQEMAEIELCPNCYLNANSKKNTWFVEVCPKPHILVWAKLKGFPYWPAKAMCTNPAGMVDVRFFGAHDRAWVHYKECYMFSEKDPNTFKQKRYDIEKCIEEVDVYIENLRKVYGEFRYAPYKTFLEPENDLRQLQILLPKYKNHKSKAHKRKIREIIAENKRETSVDESKQSASKTDKNESEKPIDSVEKQPEAVGEDAKAAGTSEEITMEQGGDTKKVDEEDSKTKIEMDQNDLDGTISSVNSPLNDTNKHANDSALEEGYGTDDSTVDDIDLERRKAFVDRNRSVNEEIMEDEEDADTQIPNNISVDSLDRGKVWMGGGLSSSPGNIKILSRRKSEAFDSVKRHANENADESTHQKLPRRNSDQSGKSDSSRISNLSDKINRIETFENMEVTLGTDDVARVCISEDISCDSSMKSGSSENSIEIKRKPVQVDIDNAEFTISPSNKLKISDTLIKRLSDSSSPEEAESSSLTTRVEKMKKSLDAIESTSGTNNDTSPSKSQTDMLIEKFKNVVEHSVVDFKEATVVVDDAKAKKEDEKENIEEIANEIEKETDTDDSETSEKTLLQEKTKEDEPADLETSESSETAKQTQDCSPSTELLKKQKFLVQPSITEFTKVLKKSTDDQDSKNKRHRKEQQQQEEEYSSKDEKTDESDSEVEDNLKSIEVDKKKIFTIIHSSLNEPQKQEKDNCEEKSVGNDAENITVEKDDNKNLASESASENIDGIKLIIKKKGLVKEGNVKIKPLEEEENATTPPTTTMTAEDSKIDEETKINSEENKVCEDKTDKNKEDAAKAKTKEADIKSTNEEKIESKTTTIGNKVIKIKIAGIKPPPTVARRHPRHEMLKKRRTVFPIRRSIDGKPIAPSNERPIDSHIIPVKASISQSGTAQGKEFRSYSNLKNKTKVSIADDVASKPIDSDDGSTQNLNEKPKDSDAVQPIETTVTSKKRKISADENTSAPSTKLVKLVPIESILNKGLMYKNVKAIAAQSSMSNIVANSNSPSMNDRAISSDSLTNKQSASEEMLVDSIKSEPESDDDFQESENLEAKKRYLSALNISEKNNDPSKDKENEIRTRARAEEKRERFKIVDNLTRVIDDVALNYSANHEGEEVPSSSATNSEGAKASANTSTTSWTESGEISVKSFAKISTSTPRNQQRARKSFPTPTKSKTLFLKHCQMSVMKKDNNNISCRTAVTSPSNVSSTLNPQIPIISAVTPTSQSLAQQHQHPQLKIPNKQYHTPNPGVSCSSVPCSSNSTITNGGNSTLEQSPPQQQQQPPQSTNASTVPISSRERPPEEDLTLLNSIVPENVTRAVSELVMRPPPKLKPKPPGMLSSVFDDGIPSSAGEITTKINSVAHRLSDYLRGMLIETLEDLGKSANPEAKIISLQLEIEALKHKHNLEIQEIKKNMGTLLKDIQRSIEENRERIIAEARAAWETETIKRVELAKSKQWCANCSKEAKFYCCWNTSYCDYPCQQKHWPQHMGKCTQNIEKSTGSSPVVPTHSGQPVILRQTTSGSAGGVGGGGSVAGASKSGTAPKMITKPTKVYMNNKTATPKTIKAYSSSGSQVTLIETTPGNFELLGNGQVMSGKIYPASSRFKSANIMSVSSTSNSMSNQSRFTNSTTKEQIRSPVAMPGSSRVPTRNVNEEEGEYDD